MAASKRSVSPRKSLVKAGFPLLSRKGCLGPRLQHPGLTPAALPLHRRRRVPRPDSKFTDSDEIVQLFPTAVGLPCLATSSSAWGGVCFRFGPLNVLRPQKEMTRVLLVNSLRRSWGPIKFGRETTLRFGSIITETGRCVMAKSLSPSGP